MVRGHLIQNAAVVLVALAALGGPLPRASALSHCISTAPHSAVYDELNAAAWGGAVVGFCAGVFNTSADEIMPISSVSCEPHTQRYTHRHTHRQTDRWMDISIVRETERDKLEFSTIDNKHIQISGLIYASFCPERCLSVDACVSKPLCVSPSLCVGDGEVNTFTMAQNAMGALTPRCRQSFATVTSVSFGSATLRSACCPLKNVQSFNA